MPYPYDEIKKVHDVKGNSITTFATRLLEAFPDLTTDVPYQTTAIPDSPEDIAFKDMGIHQKVLNVTVSNLAAFLLSNDIVNVSRIPVKWAKDSSDKETTAFFQCLLKWVKGDDYRSISSLVYLAHYETEIRKHRSMGSGNTILPGKAESAVIAHLANALMKAMGSPNVFAYRVDAYAGYNDVVNKGDIDFLVGDTLYISRLGRVYSRDRYYLLICYVIMKHSLKYKDEIINHVCLVSPSDGVCYKVDIREVDTGIIDIVHDCVYGPTVREVVETTIRRNRRVKLVVGLVDIFDVVGTNAVIDKLSTMCLTHSGDANWQKQPGIKELFERTSLYFVTPKSKDIDEDHYYLEGINYINQLLFNIENKGKEIQAVRLSDTLAYDILNRALDF